MEEVAYEIHELDFSISEWNHWRVLVNVVVELSFP
jgi:hypothetical protein